MTKGRIAEQRYKNPSQVIKGHMHSLKIEKELRGGQTRLLYNFGA